jgi:hypothetical protein
VGGDCRKSHGKLQWIVNPRVLSVPIAEAEADRRADARESVAGILRQPGVTSGLARKGMSGPRASTGDPQCGKCVACGLSALSPREDKHNLPLSYFLLLPAAGTVDTGSAAGAGRAARALYGVRCSGRGTASMLTDRATSRTELRAAGLPSC